MKAYFIGGAYMGCYYVRCLLPLIENGWSGNYLGLEKKLKPINVVAQECKEADVIVFHRPNNAEYHKLAIMLKGMGKKIVFDNDDTMNLDENHPFFALDDKGFEENKEIVNNIINNFVRNADLVTCSTEYLAEEYRQLNPNVVVLPNCVNVDDWDEPQRNEGDKIRIGLVGSTVFNHDFEHVKDILRQLDEDPRVQLVLMGLVKKSSDNPLIQKTYEKEYEFIESLKNVEHMSWVEMVDYFDALNDLRLDMMLIPRRENNFNRAKSNVKFLEASMLEIPVIAQSFESGPYEEISDGVNGFLIKDESEWLPKINRLINDKDLRRTIGKNAREYVINKYDIRKNANRWNKAYKTL